MSQPETVTLRYTPAASYPHQVLRLKGRIYQPGEVYEVPAEVAGLLIFQVGKRNVKIQRGTPVKWVPPTQEERRAAVARAEAERKASQPLREFARARPDIRPRRRRPARATKE